MAVVQADLPAEFAATDATIVAFWISVSTGEVEPAKWTACGVDPEQGIVLLASHYLKEAGEGTAASTAVGTIASERVGEVSTTYAVGNKSSSTIGDHATTAYGRAYDQLLARVQRCQSLKAAGHFFTTKRSYTA